MPTLVTPATMLRMAFASPCLFALCGLIGACVPQAKADAIADFYRARTVTVVVSSSAAGGYDTLARVVARYMGRHLPGNPVFIVRNMPGAGGIAATNFLYNNVDRDGSVIGLVQNNTPFEPLFGTKEARYDPVKFNWLGSPSSETAMVLIWHTVPVNSVADLKTHEVTVGVSGANSTPAFFTPAVERDAGHENEAHQWLSWAEQRPARYGTPRARWSSQRFLQLRSHNQAGMATREDGEGHFAIWTAEARRAS